MAIYCDSFDHVQRCYCDPDNRTSCDQYPILRKNENCLLSVDVDSPSGDRIYIYTINIMCNSMQFNNSLNCGDTIAEHFDMDNQVDYYKIEADDMNTKLLFIVSCGNYSHRNAHALYLYNTNYDIIEHISISNMVDTLCLTLRITDIEEAYVLGVLGAENLDLNDTAYSVSISCVSQTTYPVLNWRRKVFCDDNNIANNLENLQFDSISTVNGYKIGWVKMISCKEGTKSDFILRDGYTITDIVNLLSHVMSVRISPPGTSNSNPKYDDFVVETVPCSEPIYSINNKKEMTISLHHFNLSIKETNNQNDWLGSDAAKQRLSFNSPCYSYLNINKFARDFPTIYENCDDGINININTGKCQWNSGANNLQGQDMEIHLGFDVNKKTNCEYDIDMINASSSDEYILVPYRLNGDDAELFCEQNFGMPLASLDEDNMDNAINLRFMSDFEYMDIQNNFSLWIGLSKPAGFQTNCEDWKWYGCPDINDTWGYGKFCDDGHVYELFNWDKKTDDPDYSCATFQGSKYKPTKCEEEHMFLCDRENEIIEPDPVCQYYIDRIDVSSSILSVENVEISRGMSLSFEIKLNKEFVCKAERCNILHIGTSKIQLPSIYIKGDDIEIYVYDVNGKHFQPDIITNGRKLLCDDQYHLVTISFSLYERIYTIDGIKYYLQKSDYNFLNYLSQTFPMFISNSWMPSVKATIANLCIETIDIDFHLAWLYLQGYIVYVFEDYEFSKVGFAALGYWNDKMIFIDGSKIWSKRVFSTDLTRGKSNTTVGSDLSLNRIDDPEAELITPWYSQQFVQKDSELYLYSNGVIQTYDLEQLTFLSKTVVPSYYDNFNKDYNFTHLTCITTDQQYLYLIGNGILKYHITNKTFTSSSVTSEQFNSLGSACAADINTNKIYIFGGVSSYYSEILSHIPKTYTDLFDIESSWFEYLFYVFTDTVYEYDIHSDSINLLPNVTTNNGSFLMRAVFDSNRRIYLYGGFSREFLEDEIRLIFNTETKQFETITTSYKLWMPIELDDRGYMSFGSCVYDATSNLLLAYRYPDLMYLILPSSTVITFKLTDKAWRSYVPIDYILNDYTQYEGLYQFLVQYSNSTTNLQYAIMFNAYEACYLCNEQRWSRDCQDECYFVVSDNEIDSIHIELHLLQPDIEILGKTKFLVVFHKCNIDYIIYTKAGNYISVSAIPQDINLCASNPLITNGYISHIHNDEVGIDHDIVVNIVDGLKVSCVICEVSDDLMKHCLSCLNGTKATISREIEKNGSFILEMTPKTPDLIINEDIFLLSVDQRTTKDKTQSDSILTTEGIVGIIISVLFVIGVVAIGVLVFWRRNKRFKEEELRIQEEHTTYIENPMVISIGISSYNTTNKPKNPGIDIKCKDIKQISIDSLNIQKLCNKLNYELFPNTKSKKLSWTKEEIKLLFKRCGEKASSSDANYDCILCIISGYGYLNNIITSDYCLMNIDSIHRILSLNFPSLRSIPRMFVYDTCNHLDNVNYDITVNEKQNFTIDDSKFINRRVKDWAGDQKNPDWKLIKIESVSTTIKSKSNKMDGSYFIYQLVKNMMKNNDEFISEITQRIQQQNNKQTTRYISKVFNSHTMYLKFKKNKNKIDKIIDNNSTMQSMDRNDNFENDALLLDDTQMIEMEEIMHNIDEDDI
eukprot:80186_1